MDEHRVHTERYKEHPTNIQDSVFNTARQEISIHVTTTGPRILVYGTMYLLFTSCKEADNNYSHT